MVLLVPALTGFGLPMGCLAVSLDIASITKSGLLRPALPVALFFGGFQTGMTLAGRISGTSVAGYISAFDHWMLFYSASGCRRSCDAGGGFRETKAARTEILQILLLVALSFATSIDAPAAGLSLGILSTPVLVPPLIIGIVCGGISF